MSSSSTLLWPKPWAQVHLTPIRRSRLIETDNLTRKIDVTAKAISHRIARLKAIADADPSVPAMSSPVKSSPAGTSPVKARGGKATPKGKRDRNSESPAQTKTGSKTPTGGNLSEDDERDPETGVRKESVNRVLQFTNVEKRMRIKEDSDDEEEDLVVKKQKS